LLVSRFSPCQTPMAKAPRRTSTRAIVKSCSSSRRNGSLSPPGMIYCSVNGNGGRMRSFRDGPQKMAAPVREPEASSTISSGIDALGSALPSRFLTWTADSSGVRKTDVSALSVVSSSLSRRSVFGRLRWKCREVSVSVVLCLPVTTERWLPRFRPRPSRRGGKT
jgi:hypothetical protein